MKIYSLLKNIFSLSLGTTIASIIGIIFTPILSFYFSPSSYGKFAIFLGIITILSSISSLRLEQAIPLPKVKKDSIALVYVSFVLLIFSSIFFGIIFFIVDFLYPSILEISNYKLIIYLLFPIAIFFFGVFNIMLNYAVKVEGYKDLSLAQIIISVFSFILPICFFEYEEYALLFFVALGNFLGAIYLFIRLNIINEKKSSEYLKQAYEYRDFIKFSTFESLLNNLGAHAPVFIITFIFSSVEAGIFAYCSRLLNYPASLLVNVVNKPLLNEYLKIYSLKKDQLFKEIKKYYKLYFLTINSLVLIFPYIISYIFSLFVSEQWYDSVVVSKLLSPWITGLLIATPFTPLFLVLRKQKESMLFQLALFIGRVSILFLIGILFLNLNYSILSYSIFSYLLWIMIAAFLLIKSGYSFNKFVKDFMMSLFISILLWSTLKILLII
tara:strand:+ start:6584 stop:7903 length:1320 start_codon:yes stop_codon:yes gene_type:complete